MINTMLVKLSCFATLCLFTLISSDVKAQHYKKHGSQKSTKSQSKFQPPSSKEITTEETSTLDDWQSDVSRRLYRLSNKIDSYFGNIKNFEEKNGTNLQFYTNYTHEEQGHGYNDMALKLRMRLPNLEDKIQLTLELGEDDPNDAFKEAESEKLNNKNKSTRAGLNFFSPTKYVDMKLTLGWEINNNPQGFIRAKTSKDYFIDTLIYYWNFEVIHRLKDGRDYDFDFYITRPYTSHFYLRLKNSWDYNEKKHLLLGQHGPQWVWTVNNRLSYHVDLLAQTTNEFTHHVSSYHILTGTRFNLYKDFLFGEISPSLNFYQTRRFKGLAALSFKIEMLFGDY